LLQCVPPNIQHHALNIVSFYLQSVVYRFEFVRQSHVMADESSQCRPSLGRIPVAQKDRSFHPAILLSSWIDLVLSLLLRESHILIISFLFVYQPTSMITAVPPVAFSLPAHERPVSALTSNSLRRDRR